MLVGKECWILQPVISSKARLYSRHYILTFFPSTFFFWSTLFVDFFPQSTRSRYPRKSGAVLPMSGRWRPIEVQTRIVVEEQQKELLLHMYILVWTKLPTAEKEVAPPGGRRGMEAIGLDRREIKRK